MSTETKGVNTPQIHRLYSHLLTTTKVKGNKYRICKMTTIGENIKKARRNAKITQADLAHLLYVDRSTVSKWETSQSTPNLKDLNRISECLKVDISYFLDETNSDNESDTKCSKSETSEYSDLKAIQEYFVYITLLLFSTQFGDYGCVFCLIAAIFAEKSKQPRWLIYITVLLFIYKMISVINYCI